MLLHSPLYRRRNRGPERGTCPTPLVHEAEKGWQRARDSHIGGEDPVDEVLLRKVEGTLQLVVIEGDLAWAGAVEPGLHERGPRVLQQEAAPHVVLAHSGHPGVHSASTIVLHRVFPQEKVCEQPYIIGCHEVWLCRAEEEQRGGSGQWGRRGQS